MKLRYSKLTLGTHYVVVNFNTNQWEPGHLVQNSSGGMSTGSRKRVIMQG